MACAMLKSSSLAVASQAHDVCVRCCTALKKRLSYLGLLKQLIEDFASKIAKILNKLKKLPKTSGLFLRAVEYKLRIRLT